ncbi:hypothetical protein BDN72DRAFT_895361 [Pluteus cervinus]|uniref:Uncharacterized protein n=1 Tax=Pluteus cervinus TaxID=181527 RepID=A0ACD3B2I6_9AGAR|nr:hypothetical protein BDN72DRAFT_895361 [Pluteus cervinus]
MKPLCSDTGLTSELESKSANFSTTSIDPPSIQAGPGIAGQPIPVLNLGELNQENSGIQDATAGSAKKKRRRKKKKKHKSAVDTQQAPDTQHTTLQPPASSTLPEIALTSVLPDIPNDESMKPLCSDTGLTSELESKSANFSTTSIDPPSIQAGPGIAGQPIPVLNLGELNQENSGIQDATAGSAKKKRRRKKKKKTLQDAKSNDVLASN